MKIAMSTTIDEYLVKKLDILAEQEGRTRSNMVEQILKERLKYQNIDLESIDNNVNKDNKTDEQF